MHGHNCIGHNYIGHNYIEPGTSTVRTPHACTKDAHGRMEAQIHRITCTYRRHGTHSTALHGTARHETTRHGTAASRCTVRNHTTWHHHTAPYCTTLHRILCNCGALNGTVPHRTALYRTVSLRTAPHYTARPCTALHGIAPHRRVPKRQSTAVHCNCSAPEGMAL